MPEKVDVDDFDKALDTPESQSRFVIIKDDEALITAMNASLEMWRIFLHPTQKRFAINDRNGPMRVLGGAGTGKTVLAMHRAVWLAEKYGSEQKKILFTTFTKNLAIDIEQNLKKLCPPSLLKELKLPTWMLGFIGCSENMITITKLFMTICRMIPPRPPGKKHWLLKIVHCNSMSLSIVKSGKKSFWLRASLI